MVEDILAVALIFGGGTLFLLAISPIGRAIAERIKGSGAAGRAGETRAQETFQDELQELRREVGELAERLDFMERLQAKPREAERLAPPR